MHPWANCVCTINPAVSSVKRARMHMHMHTRTHAPTRCITRIRIGPHCNHAHATRYNHILYVPCTHLTSVDTVKAKLPCALLLWLRAAALFALLAHTGEPTSCKGLPVLAATPASANCTRWDPYTPLRTSSAHAVVLSGLRCREYADGERKMGVPMTTQLSSESPRPGDPSLLSLTIMVTVYLCSRYATVSAERVVYAMVVRSP